MKSNIEVYYTPSSSNISKIEYDHLMESLTVFFKSGTHYQYVSVSYQIYNDFILAESFGKYFITNIKGKFEYLKYNDK